MPRPIARALRVESLEGRCLPSGNPAVPLLTPEHLGVAPSLTVSSSSPVTKAGLDDASRSSANLSSLASTERDTPTSGKDRSDSPLPSDKSSSSKDETSEKRASSTGTEDHSAAPPSPVDTEHSPPVGQSDTESASSLSDTASAQRQSSEDDLPYQETASLPASDTKPSIAQDDTSARYAPPRHTRAVAPADESAPDDTSEPVALFTGLVVPSSLQGKMQGCAGTLSLSVDSGTVQTARAAAEDEQIPGEVAPVFGIGRPLASKARDNNGANEGQIASNSLRSGQTGSTAERPTVVCPTQDVSSDTSDIDAFSTMADYAEAALPTCAVLLTDVLPMDFSALESSICAFFADMECWLVFWNRCLVYCQVEHSHLQLGRMVRRQPRKIE
jgi:hypothetical protein